MIERALFLGATVCLPVLLSLMQAHYGLGATGVCGALAMGLLYTLGRQPYAVRRAVARQTQTLLHTQGLLQQQLAAQHQAQATLHQAREAAEQASRAKNILLINVSHELRMPLNAIIGYSEMLQEEAASLSGRGLLGEIEQIHAASLHMRALIADLLDLSRLEAGAMAFWLETFDIADLFQEIIGTLQPCVQQHDNTFEMHMGGSLGTMHADRPKLRKSLDNLLRHASAFTRHGTIALHVTREIRDGRDWLLVHVRDTAPGISQAQIEYLFQDVVCSEASSARPYGGAGFGLALSRRLCRMMGGDITLASVLNQGSVYTLRVPVQVVLPPALVAAAALPADPPELPQTMGALVSTRHGSAADHAEIASDMVPSLR